MTTPNVGSTREPYVAPPNGTSPHRAAKNDGAEAPFGSLDDETHTTGETKPIVTRTPPRSPAEIVRQWVDEGPLQRIATRIEPLDDLCRGGFPFPWRVIIVGAPSAGKTALEICIASGLVDAGVCVGCLAVDEEPEDLTVRLAQIAGYSVADAEQRDPHLLARMAGDLEARRIRLYDSSHTIETAAADLAAWARDENRLAALFLDSLQTVSSSAPPLGNTTRAFVEANVVAMRNASTRHRMLVVATAEANRAAYRTTTSAEETNDLAAGAESRAIEFAAQTQMMVRTPRDAPDIVHVNVAKNRRARKGDFFLRLDGERHALTPCPNPADDPTIGMQRAEESKKETRAEVVRDAAALLDVIRANPGTNERGLRAGIKAAGNRWGVERTDAAKLAARRGVNRLRLVDRGVKDDAGKGPVEWHVEPIGTSEVEP